MKRLKRMAALLCLCLMVLSLQVAATEAPTEAPTLPPLTVGIRTLSRIPENWNPLTAQTEEQKAVLALTSQPLYQLDAEGQMVSVQAAAMPVDVTEAYAGSYGIPAFATRGYAFAIELREDIFWQNGKNVTAADWQYTIEKHLEQDSFRLEIANFEAYLRGDTHPAEQIVSLMDAGFDSIRAAEEAGHRDFYLDTTRFWGLETGWQRVTNRNKLFDAAIPSGCEEMYVTPAYLYREYLGKNGSQTMFQSEFVGIPAEQGAALTMEDVGLFVTDGKLILVLTERTTPSHLALVLSGLYPIPTGANTADYGTAGNYLSCGPYQVSSVEKNEIILIPNPNWGSEAAYDQIWCRLAS